VETVQSMQIKISATEKDLLCGTHPGEDAETTARLIRAGQRPTPNRHNCSGKHTGMLAYARLCGLPLADYINPHHGIQQSILATFAEMCEMMPNEVVVGVDGCSAPNFAVPLVKAASALARLADPSDLSPTRAAALRKIFSAMNSEPEMVRGLLGFDTELMRVLPTTLVAKGGAEGYQALAIAPGAFGPNSPALGVAIKCADGAGRAVAPVVLEVLCQLEVLGEKELDALATVGYAPRQPVKNWRGLVVGEIRPCFALKS
jgi:L-asparaginase II